MVDAADVDIYNWDPDYQDAYYDTHCDKDGWILDLNKSVKNKLKDRLNKARKYYYTELGLPREKGVEVLPAPNIQYNNIKRLNINTINKNHTIILIATKNKEQYIYGYLKTADIISNIKNFFVDNNGLVDVPLKLFKSK